MNVLGRIFLNSRKDRRKDVEELTFLIIYEIRFGGGKERDSLKSNQRSKEMI